jgi:hypothetical protein
MKTTVSTSVLFPMKRMSKEQEYVREHAEENAKE